MKVKGIGGVASSKVKKAKSKSTSDGSAFAGALRTDSASSAAAPVMTNSVAAVDALLNYQEVPDASSGKSRGLLYGKSVLDQLEDIRRGILLGAIPRARLKALSAVIKKRRDQFEDADLADILDQIELRARVELAKLDSDL